MRPDASATGSARSWRSFTRRHLPHAPGSRSCRVDLIIIQLPGGWRAQRDPRGARRARPPAPRQGGHGYGAICLRLPALLLPNQADIMAPRTPTRSPSSHFKSSAAAAPTGGYKPDRQRPLNKCLLISALYH